jgi:formylglycine-generating enzyme required for sulfatase activity
MAQRDIRAEVSAMARIFLCHASEDKPQVRDVYQRLKALGFEPWLDEVNILPGQDWDFEIEQALETSDFVIVFLSTRSVEKVGYVQREFRRALYHAEEMPEGFIHTIPVKLDDCTVPRRFSRHQWANLYDEGAFERIVQAIRTGLLQRPVHQTTLEGLSAKTELAAIRNQMLKANSVWELREALYSTERLLERYPNYPEARLLKDQIDAVILYERAHISSSISMEFVLISAGTFLMGSPDSDAGAYDNEKPAHQVTISQPFYLGKYPVTQAQWATVMGNNPSVFKGHPDWPVENVSWEDVHEFIQTLKAREDGEDYRLPTEAEWEYACRAGSTTSYCFGDDPNQLGEYAWYKENAGGQPHPVGLLKPNAWGLYDMHGNVWEWVQDRYRPYPTDPLSASPGLERVDRGGSWVWDARFCRSATRGHLTPSHRAYDTGFRLLREVR